MGGGLKPGRVFNRNTPSKEIYGGFTDWAKMCQVSAQPCGTDPVIVVVNVDERSLSGSVAAGAGDGFLPVGCLAP